MKKIQILAALMLVLTVFACKNTGTEAAAPAVDTTMMSTTETMTAAPDTMAMAFACPMHPEVTGKEGDKCSKCGMDLVAAKKEEPGHEGHDH
jgi:hypothetical protein